MVRKFFAFALLLANLLAFAGLANAEEKVGYVISTGLYIRRSASTKSEILRCADNGEKLIILREEGDWYYVKYNSVVSGYAAKKFISLKKPATSTSSDSGSAKPIVAVSNESLPSKISDLGDPPATTKSGDRGANVKKLQQALKIIGYYSGSCDGIYGDGTSAAVKKFQKSKGLSQDGVAGKVTINLLFGDRAANDDGSDSSGSGSKTEKLDWYKTGASVIPRGAYFIVKDIRSGVTFKAKHLFGANHLDAEPATKEDTAKLLRIYGGSWSWSRRPVLLSYGSHVLAASMNGMPHGEQSIYDNNFEGQFCIHFLNSKTHGSSKVDPDHQACVNEAAKSSW